MTLEERIYYEEHGSAEDTYSLSWMFLSGYEPEDIGVDYEKAASYMRKLIQRGRNGDIVAQCNIVLINKDTKMYDTMKYYLKEDVDSLQQIFRENILKKAETGNDADALFASACVLHPSTSCNFEEFKKWYKIAAQAARNGSSWACSKLMWKHVYDQHHVEDNSLEFLMLGTKGSDVYASMCQDFLGSFYRYGDEYGGQVFAQNIEKFVYWTKIAYQNGSLQAKHRLDSYYRTTSGSRNTSSGGCYVATAVYGSYDCPEVWTLRRYRDSVLKQSVLGRIFISMYYAISPKVVKWFGKEKWFNIFFKRQLDVFVKKLNANGINNSPYND